MACNASKLPLIRAISTRGFAAQPSTQSCTRAPACISSTVLQNKLFVAANDNGAPVARVTIAYKAGSRFEPANELGLSHVLRTAAGIGTSNSTAYGIMRNLQQLGANLTATVDRETICYTLEATKNNIEEAVMFLNDVASKQIFNPWEFDEVLERVRYETAGLTPQVRALDLLHKAAFRRGLGNSLFCSPRQAGKISSESLQHFVANNFLSDRCAVGVAGLSLERAVAVAQTLCLPQGSSTQMAPSPYKGGEVRKEMGGELAHVAVAAKGASLGNAKEAIALSILARALGNGPQVKWGATNSPLNKSISSQLGDTPFAVNAFNISFSDDGLFGFLVSAPRCSAGKAVQAATQVLSCAGSVGADQLKKGRAQLLTEVLYAGDSHYLLAEDLAIQGLLTGAITKASDLADIICKVSDSEISNVASKISKGKLSMGAAGNLETVPYVDELQ